MRSLKQPRLALAILLCFVLGSAELRAQGSPPHSIAPGVWFLTGDTNGYSNTVVIEMRDYLIVVDANYPGRAKELLGGAAAQVERAGSLRAAARTLVRPRRFDPSPARRQLTPLVPDYHRTVGKGWPRPCQRALDSP